MGFLKRRDRSSYRDATPAGSQSSFKDITEQQLDELLDPTHMLGPSS